MLPGLEWEPTLQRVKQNGVMSPEIPIPVSTSQGERFLIWNLEHSMVVVVTSFKSIAISAQDRPGQNSAW